MQKQFMITSMANRRKKSLAAMLFKEDKSYGEISKIIFGNEKS